MNLWWSRSSRLSLGLLSWSFVFEMTEQPQQSHVSLLSGWIWSCFKLQYWEQIKHRQNVYQLNIVWKFSTMRSQNRFRLIYCKLHNEWKCQQVLTFHSWYPLRATCPYDSGFERFWGHKSKHIKNQSKPRHTSSINKGKYLYLLLTKFVEHRARAANQGLCCTVVSQSRTSLTFWNIRPYLWTHLAS